MLFTNIFPIAISHQISATNQCGKETNSNDRTGYFCAWKIKEKSGKNSDSTSLQRRINGNRYSSQEPG